MLARYLANRPDGMPEAYLIAAAVVFAVGGIVASWSRDIWRAAIATGLVGLCLALLTR